MIIFEKRLLMQNFNEIPVNTTDIPQSDLNIDVRIRTNLFAWNGQFSPQFVEAILNKYSDENYTVIDPFLGSGTVLVESARKNLNAYGTELNVSAYSMAKTYELCSLNLNDRNSLIYDIQAIVNSAIEAESPFEYIVNAYNSEPNTVLKNVLLTLVVLLDIYNNKITNEKIVDKWNSLAEIITNLPYTTKSIVADNGDSRHMNLSDDSADMLLTSPPYINVFNYHQKYRASVESLGFNVLAIAKSEFGSNRKNRGNRLYTVIQYCIDIALSLKEASRVCKPNARMIYVVGRESTVLGYSFCNSELVYNLGTQIFGFDFLLRQERVFKNRYGQMIYEDILHFNNVKSNLEDEYIINESRRIAVEMLSSKLNITNDNITLLKEAIKKATSIIPSEVYNA